MISYKYRIAQKKIHKIKIDKSNKKIIIKVHNNSKQYKTCKDTNINKSYFKHENCNQLFPEYINIFEKRYFRLIHI